MAGERLGNIKGLRETKFLSHLDDIFLHSCLILLLLNPGQSQSRPGAPEPAQDAAAVLGLQFVVANEEVLFRRGRAEACQVGRGRPFPASSRNEDQRTAGRARFGDTRRSHTVEARFPEVGGREHALHLDIEGHMIQPDERPGPGEKHIAGAPVQAVGGTDRRSPNKICFNHLGELVKGRKVWEPCHDAGQNDFGARQVGLDRGAKILDSKVETIGCVRREGDPELFANEVSDRFERVPIFVTHIEHLLSLWRSRASSS